MFDTVPPKHIRRLSGLRKKPLYNVNKCFTALATVNEQTMCCLFTNKHVGFVYKQLTASRWDRPRDWAPIAREARVSTLQFDRRNSCEKKHEEYHKNTQRLDSL